MNQEMPEISAIAIRTDKIAEKALPKRSRSKKRAKGNSEMEIKIEKMTGKRILCVKCITTTMSIRAINEDASSNAYGRLFRFWFIISA